jgi:hypothetical protein
LPTTSHKNSKPPYFTRHADMLPAWLEANGYGLGPPPQPDRPTTYQNLDAFTIRRMLDLPNWLTWRWEKVHGRFTKVPFIGGTVGLALKADASLKSTWRSHDVALKHVRDGLADGIGFCLLETGVGAIDIDHCRNAETGVIHPYALELIARSKSYTEITPSGTGLRVIGLTWGTKVLHSKQKVPGTPVSVERYRNATRYITVTGLHLEGTPDTLNQIGDILDIVHAELGGTADTTSSTPHDEPIADDEPPATDDALNFLEASLPQDLRDEIQIDAEVGKRSDQFYHAVRWLKEPPLKTSLADITALLEKYPNGIANKYVVAKTLRKEIKRAFGKPDNPKDNTKTKDDAGTASAKTKAKLIQSSEEFTRDFIPPDYLWDRVLLCGFAYCFTGPTGHGKTAIQLSLSASVALGKDFAGREVTQGKVLYFAGENPDDVRMRWIAMAEHMNFDADIIDVYFIEGTFDIAKLEKKVREEVKALGGVVLIIVDTSPAYFQGDAENDNMQMIEHAKMLRRLKDLPGNPTVLAACHPVKNATKDNLLPRGGGGFLNELDGNLTGWCDDMLVSVHHQGKFRGVDFEPMGFQLEPVIARKLIDSRGRHIPTVLAHDLSKDDQNERQSELRGNEDAILILLKGRKVPTSLMDIRMTCRRPKRVTKPAGKQPRQPAPLARPSVRFDRAASSSRRDRTAAPAPSQRLAPVGFYPPGGGRRVEDDD